MQSIRQEKFLNLSLILVGLLLTVFFFFDFDSISFSKEKSSEQLVREVLPTETSQQRSVQSEGVIQGAKETLQKLIKPGQKPFALDPEITVPIQGRMWVEIIDSRTICVVGDYDEFLRERFWVECGEELKRIEDLFAKGKLPDWSRDASYGILPAEIILKYRPLIAQVYNNGKKFRISDGITVKEYGYWVNPIGLMRINDLKSGEELRPKVAQVIHYAFLRLDSDLEVGKEYTIENPLGEKSQFIFDDTRNINQAIKVNQVGYSDGAGRKYAYIGSWLGTLGAMNLSKLEGRDYYLKEEESGEIVYRGFLSKRLVKEAGKPDYTGEDVYEADFSDFNQKGLYHLYLPGMGRSYPFLIGEDAIGVSFYTHAKGLFNKRCGIAKESPYTAWYFKPCHLQTYQSNFPPNDTHYVKDKNGDRDFGFFDEKGNSVSVKHFTLIRYNNTEKVVEGVLGGWHDAADYDRRPYHLEVVNSLLSVYLMNPKNFKDGQLNIPESGDGLPDVINEALWGLEPWRKAQKDNGAAGGWIEAESHPKITNPGEDTQHYYLSAATCESSMQYAGYASMAALALKEVGDRELAEIYQESARRAYEFGLNPANRFIASYRYPVIEKVDGKNTIVMHTYSYREKATVPIGDLFKSSFNLYLLTRDKKYLEPVFQRKKELLKEFSDMFWATSPLVYTEFLLNGKDSGLDEYWEAYRKSVLKTAETRLAWMEDNYPYRIPWYPIGHAYVSHMSWGNYHPARLARFFIAAYQISRERVYRDAAYLCNDWHNGVNPTGQVMTSGLGVNYPIRFLDLPSYGDDIAEYVLGITPYRNTYGIARDDVKIAHALYYDLRKDKNFFPKPTMLFSEEALGTNQLSVEEFSKQLGKMWPVWRRFANVEDFSVAASEYTVHETIAPAVLLTGWLLNQPWVPDEKIKTRKPVNDLKALKGYGALP